MGGRTAGLAARRKCIYTVYINYKGVAGRAKARVFRSGKSQAVRQPKQFRVKSKELETYKYGDEIVQKEEPAGMERAFDLIASLPEEVLHIRRGKDRPQKRKGV